MNTNIHIPVRLRTSVPVDMLVHGSCEQTNSWCWYSNVDIAGAVTAEEGFIPDLDSGDDQENYWWVRTPDGVRIAFQSIDVEEVN